MVQQVPPDLSPASKKANGLCSRDVGGHPWDMDSIHPETMILFGDLHIFGTIERFVKHPYTLGMGLLWHMFRLPS